MDQTTMAQLKVDLYRAILLKTPSGLTSSEIELGYWLAKDNDIQKKLSLNKSETLFASSIVPLLLGIIDGK